MDDAAETCSGAFWQPWNPKDRDSPDSQPRTCTRSTTSQQTLLPPTNHTPRDKCQCLELSSQPTPTTSFPRRQTPCLPRPDGHRQRPRPHNPPPQQPNSSKCRHIRARRARRTKLRLAIPLVQHGHERLSRDPGHRRSRHHRPRRSERATLGRDDLWSPQHHYGGYSDLPEGIGTARSSQALSERVAKYPRVYRTA